MIYPVNFDDGYVEHPKSTRKPQALIHVPETASLLVPNGNYVLIKRFSSKEEKKRVVSVVYEADRFDVDWVGFENHLNYFHRNGKGLDINLAKGLSLYLNSSLVDSFFRLFNGHTQINATDLRNLKYPTLEQLLFLGKQEGFLSQQQIDEIMEERLLSMEDQENESLASVKIRITEALEILKQLGFPRAQLNERSALTLLALINLKASESWQSCSSPLMGITPMMDFMAEHYGKT
ncbi:adenine methyltransferase, partial [Cylindrospermopsis raciborskii S14]